VIIQVKIPEKLSKKQREMLENFYDENEDKEAKKGLFDRLKDAIG
jgi:molecular chaperone DnaJ